MKYCFTLFLSCLLLFSTDLMAQFLRDSTRIRFRINAEVHGEHHFYRVAALTAMPKLIQQLRRNTTELPVTFDTITDAPFRHGTLYAAIKTVTTIANKIELKADLYSEYRGFSYGSFNKENRVLYPIVSASYNDSIRLGNSFLNFHADGGQYLNDKIDEGLMIYNVDMQRVKVTVRYGNSQLSGAVYTDLMSGIGLNIDDLIHISYSHFFANDKATAGVSYVIAAPAGWRPRYNSYINVFTRINTKNGSSYYAQAGFSTGFYLFDIYKGLNRQLAVLLGMEHHLQKRNLSVTCRAEVRYYGHTFNAFHHDTRYRYRNPASNPEEMYNNTIGKYLYPIRKFNTPFSQWSVFTEYFGNNLFGASVTGNIVWKSSEKISFHLDYDVNGIYARLDKDFADPGSRLSSFIYPFFKTAVRYYPTKEGYISFFVANKAMNLDLGYPTQYLMRRPFAGIEFQIDI